jgi:hypothetical protein
MTLGSFILTLRKRLQDNYKTDGSLIAAAGDDGIRWSSAELLSITNEAMVESANLLYTYMGKEPLVDSAFLFQATLTFVTNTKEIPDDALNIIDAFDAQNNTPYTRKSRMDYLKFKHSDREPRSEGCYFSQYQDTSDSKRYMELNPTPQGTGDIHIIYLRSKSNYVIGDIATELLLNGLDYIVLDVAERKARDIEHNWERSRILDNRIVVHLGGVQNANDTNRRSG